MDDKKNEGVMGLNLYYNNKKCFYPICLRDNLFPPMRNADPNRVVLVTINGQSEQVSLKELETDAEYSSDSRF